MFADAWFWLAIPSAEGPIRITAREADLVTASQHDTPSHVTNHLPLLDINNLLFDQYHLHVRIVEHLLGRQFDHLLRLPESRHNFVPRLAY